MEAPKPPTETDTKIPRTRKVASGVKKVETPSKAAEVKLPELKLFDRWPTADIKVNDAGLANYLSLEPRLVPKSYQRFVAKRPFYKARLNVVERLINHLYVVGHRGKKHRITSGRNTGKTVRATNTLIEAFETIEKQTGKNPVEVLVRAIENAAPTEEVISYQKGGIFVREAVVSSPQRRADLALKHLSQGAYQKSFRNRRSAAQALAEEIMAAARRDAQGSYAVSERLRREKEAAENR